MATQEEWFRSMATRTGEAPVHAAVTAKVSGEASDKARHAQKGDDGFGRALAGLAAGWLLVFGMLLLIGIGTDNTALVMWSIGAIVFPLVMVLGAVLPKAVYVLGGLALLCNLRRKDGGRD